MDHIDPENGVRSELNTTVDVWVSTDIDEFLARRAARPTQKGAITPLKGLNPYFVSPPPALLRRAARTKCIECYFNPGCLPGRAVTSLEAPIREGDSHLRPTELRIGAVLHWRLFGRLPGHHAEPAKCAVVIGAGRDPQLYRKLTAVFPEEIHVVGD